MVRPPLFGLTDMAERSSLRQSTPANPREDGLEQEFNTLDAHMRACAAYAPSQHHEGWVLAKERYDDGGFWAAIWIVPA